jgi:hypothetical protein
VMTHIIPPERLTLEYLSRLMQGSAKSFELLRHKYGIWTPPVRRAWPTRLFGQLQQFRAQPEVRQVRNAYVRGVKEAAEQIARGR